MTRCECCHEPATVHCAGTDVPPLWFCDDCGKWHEETCPEIRDGNSWMHYPENES